MTFSFERICLALIAIAGLVTVGIATERYGFMARELKDQRNAITQLSMKIDALKTKPSMPDVQINQVAPGMGGGVGRGMGIAEPGAPASITPTPTEPPFPIELIGKKSLITETWIKPVRVEYKKECYTSEGDLGTERFSLKCSTVAEASLSSDKGITVQIIRDENSETAAHIRFLKDKKLITVPEFPISADSHAHISYVDEKTIYIQRFFYEGWQEYTLKDGAWTESVIPDVVLQAYPMVSKPPFKITLGKRYTSYLEYVNHFSGGGYEGQDPTWNKWALEYIFDRSTGKIVETRAVERSAK